jgi:hypothetical protein
VNRSTGSDSRSRPAILSQMIRDLSDLEQAEVLRDFPAPTAYEVGPDRRTPNRRQWVVRFLAVCCFGLIPWTIGLALTLPRTYLVDNWPLAWTGFDVILLGCLSTTAWALWKQRQIAVPASMITSVLLLCDAWFDVVTAKGSHCLTVSIITAAFGEIPIAMLLGLISVRLLHAGVRAARGSTSGTGGQSLWRTPLISPTKASQIAPGALDVGVGVGPGSDGSRTDVRPRPTGEPEESVVAA